ncbi:MAG: CoB--CoM heterodisulfide reductase subunit B [Candidatus Bathyarchaeia archaeon]
MRYSLFLGCVIPARQSSYELSTRKVLQSLGVEVVDLKDENCCGLEFIIGSIDHKTGLALAARNLCLAEEYGLDILTLCSGCFDTLKSTNEALRGDPEAKKEVNSILSEIGRQFTGSVEVRHLLGVLYNDVGIERVKGAIEKPLKELKVGVHYPCHLLKPSEVLRFDDPEQPRTLDELVEATGAESVNYIQKMLCCGGLLRGVYDEVATDLVRTKLSNLRMAGVDCLVTVCPMCYLQFEMGQMEIRRRFNEYYNIPILHYPELLGLAMGLDYKELGMHTHRIKVEGVLEKLG